MEWNILNAMVGGRVRGKHKAAIPILVYRTSGKLPKGKKKTELIPERIVRNMWVKVYSGRVEKECPR